MLALGRVAAPAPHDLVTAPAAVPIRVVLQLGRPGGPWEAGVCALTAGAVLHSLAGRHWARSPARFRRTNRLPRTCGSSSSQVVLREEAAQETKEPHACLWCGQRFPSRQKLFRHLRGSMACVDAAERALPGSAAALASSGEPQAVAFKVAYQSNASQADELVRAVLDAAGACEVELARCSDDSSRKSMRLVGFDTSVVAQEPTCGAAADVVSACFKSCFAGDALMARISASIESLQAAKMHRPEVQILDAVMLPQEQMLHAEVSCSQRIYFYYVPLDVMEPAAATEDALLSMQGYHVLNNLQGVSPAFAQRIRKLKANIRAAVACMEPDLGEDGTNRAQRFAGRRLYGSENRRQYRWHNFAPPELTGSLSPQKETVRRAMDKVFIGEVVVVDGRVFVSIAMSGDHFLTQQCRRLVASLLCIFRGWLPPDFLQLATRADVVVDTPLAPDHLLVLRQCKYAAWARYHGRLFDSTWFERAERGGLDIDERPCLAQHGHDPPQAYRQWREALLTRIAGAEQTSESAMAEWLHRLECDDAPRIRRQLRVQAGIDDFVAGRWNWPSASTPHISGSPPEYLRVLQLLQEIRHSGRWPQSSVARSRVVRAGDGGTFSVGTTREGQWPSNGTREFPELTEAVFELERAIGPPSRSPSTMCAVNCNALFAPHTDSGAGFGQTTSLIVGLGPYSGGELVVEGTAHDIQYRPLEFDGWRQRHWTLPYTGDRFSLVWFTPA